MGAGGGGGASHASRFKVKDGERLLTCSVLGLGIFPTAVQLQETTGQECLFISHGGVGSNPKLVKAPVKK